MSDKVRLWYEPICLLGDPAVVYLKDGAWTLNEELVDETFHMAANSGANGARLNPYAVYWNKTDRAHQFCPYLLDKATDKWDLTKWNPDYFRILRRVVELANDVNLDVWLTWFDGCEVQIRPNGQPQPWGKWSPWIENIQKTGTFYNAAADPYTKAWIKKVHKELDGLRVKHPFGNETCNKAFVDMAKRVIFPLVKELAIPFTDLTYGAIMEDAPYLGNGQYDEKVTVQDTVRRFFGEYFPPEKNKTIVIREVHGCGVKVDKDRPYGDRVEQALCWWAKNPVGPMLLSTDGVKDGDSKCDKASDGARPSAKVLGGMVEYVLGRKKDSGFGYCPQTSDLDCQADSLRAMSEAVEKATGDRMDNLDKWPYTPPEPPDPPDPPTPPEPPDPDGGIRWWVVGAIIAVVLALLLILF